MQLTLFDFVNVNNLKTLVPRLDSAGARRHSDSHERELVLSRARAMGSRIWDPPRAVRLSFRAELILWTMMLAFRVFRDPLPVYAINEYLHGVKTPDQLSMKALEELRAAGILRYGWRDDGQLMAALNVDHPQH